MENLKIGQKEIMVKPEVPPRRNANPHKGHQSSNLNKSGEILTENLIWQMRVNLTLLSEPSGWNLSGYHLKWPENGPNEICDDSLN